MASPVRIELAKQRIRNILRKHLLASEKQLESKIAEAGPANQRCNPHVISIALKILVTNNEVDSLAGPRDAKFYFLSGVFDPLSRAAHSSRRERVFGLYEKYRQLTFQKKPNVCGQALEDILWTAIGDSDRFLFLGKKGSPLSNFGNVTLPGHFDMVMTAKATAPVAVLVEAKNLREWLYPSSIELWELIHKALVFRETGYPTLPVIVCRKIQYSTRLLFSRIGILGVETHRQYFSPAVSTELIEIKHKDGLGFHDISCDTEPPPWLRRFFERTVITQAESCTSTFEDSSEILIRYAKTLASKLRRTERFAAWRALCLDLSHSPEYEEEEG